MITVDQYYNEVKECIYKGEVYSARDNGAVMRHSREGKRLRKDDNIWTFGKVDQRTGYNLIGTERVHRIVAYAFLGEPPTAQHVVDHIDTNRQNNRPENKQSHHTIHPQNHTRQGKTHKRSSTKSNIRTR